MLSKIEWMETSGHKLENASRWLWLLIFVITLLTLPPPCPQPCVSCPLRPGLCTVLPQQLRCPEGTHSQMAQVYCFHEIDNTGVIYTCQSCHSWQMNQVAFPERWAGICHNPALQKSLDSFPAILQKWAHAFPPSVVSSCACQRGNSTLPFHCLPPAFLGYLGTWRGFFL